MKNLTSSQRHFRPEPSSQRGVILIITLVAMVILLVSGIALMRSFDTSLLLAGNLSFKRDLINQAERGYSAATKALTTGGALGADATRQTDQLANNYSSTILASDSHGLPQMLTNDTLWTMTGADIVDNTTGVTIRYVIDRLCNTTGPSSVNTCVFTQNVVDVGGSIGIARPPLPSPIVYRISVRVTGPRNTQSYSQITVSI